MMAKSHDLWLVGKLRSNPFKCIQAYVSIFSLSRDIHQTLDKSKTCQHFWKSLYIVLPWIYIPQAWFARRKQSWQLTLQSLNYSTVGSHSIPLNPPPAHHFIGTTPDIAATCHEPHWVVTSGSNIRCCTYEVMGWWWVQRNTMTHFRPISEGCGSHSRDFPQTCI